jgi:hypothetical protein
MAQILDPVPSSQRNIILCCYVNATSHIQVARITNISSWYFERVVFPGQRLVFEALPQALLEIHTGMMASSILSDTIPCERLYISDGGDEGEIEADSASMPVSATTDNKRNIDATDDFTVQESTASFQAVLVGTV